MFLSEPILISSLEDGLYVASTLNYKPVQAVSYSKARAKEYLQRKLQQLVAKGKHASTSEIKSVEMGRKSFEAQPMFIRRQRRYPAGPTIQIEIRFLKVIDKWDKIFGVVPDLGIDFYCPKESDFGTMLNDMVVSSLATATPEQLIGYWAPTSTEVDWLRVRVNPKREQLIVQSSTRTLQSIAEPIGRHVKILMPPKLRQGQLREIRSQIQQSSCLLVGESGVGKTTLLHIAVRNYVNELRINASDPLEQMTCNTKFWTTSASRLLSGMRYLGQWQERIERVIAELSERNGVLLVENLRDLITAGGQSPADSMGAFLIPYLRTGQLRLVAEATPSQLVYCQRQLPSLVDLLSIVHIGALEPDDEVTLLQHVIQHRNDELTSDESFATARTIQRLCQQYMTSRPAPSGSMSFVEQWLAKHSSRSIGQVKDWNENAIAEFSKWTGLPTSLLQDSVLLERRAVEEELAKDVIGQPIACQLSAGIILRLKAAMNDSQRPLGCLLFCGPTGVGKTQLAKSLAKYLFGAGGKSGRFIRLDMSEYQSVSAGDRFLNDPKGDPANWIQQVRSQSLQVVLFDEIEKASPEVFDILLSLLDEGRLTDRFGNLTSFRSTIILMTSNLGATNRSLAGFQSEKGNDYLAAVRKAMRPEFLNRLDGIVPFAPLSRESIKAMTRKELQDSLNREGIVRLGLQVEYDDSLVDHISQVGFSETLGARPLQRAVESIFVSQLATWIVETLPQPGARVRASWESGKLVCTNQE